MDKTEKNIEILKGFIPTYTSYLRFFNANEVVFIMHMLEIDYYRNQGYRMAWSREFMMLQMRMKRPAYARCIKRFLALNLISREVVGKRVVFHWNMSLYMRLLEVLTATRDYYILTDFFDDFTKKERSIESITDDEIRSLCKK